MNAVTERQVGGDRVPAADSILTRTCARPGCSAPAAATLAFFYSTREVSLEKLGFDEMPATYDLCATHADRMRPPYGWVLNDSRTVPKGTETGPHSSAQQDMARSDAETSLSATEASSQFRWLGVAVQATVAFYPPDSEAFDAIAPVEPGGESTRFEAGSSEASRFESGPQDATRFGAELSEASLFEPGPDEASLFEPGLNESLPEEDFVPVRAQSW